MDQRISNEAGISPRQVPVRTTTIRFVLDNRLMEIEFDENNPIDPSTTVLNFLRSLPGHKGVKEGCAEGDCGACTVVLTEPGKDGKLTYTAVDSCLLFLPMIHGKQLITVENLAQRKEGMTILHPVQRIMVSHYGSQCGYCTPGIILSLFSLYKNHVDPTDELIIRSLAGNLCRCTGYQPVLDSAREICSCGEPDHFTEEEPRILEILNGIRAGQTTLELRSEHQLYFKPFTLSEALRIRTAHPIATIISGSTDIALRQTKKKEHLPVILDLSDVEELRRISASAEEWIIGAGVHMEDLRIWSEKEIPALHEMLNLFGSLQIRNLATPGGNIGSASPIGDTLPLLMALNASVLLRSAHGERRIRLEAFIKGYRTTDLGSGELITAVIIPKPDPQEILWSHKVSKRKDLDISSISAGFRLKLAGGQVQTIFLAFGGMAATPVRAKATENFLTGKTWDRVNVESAAAILRREFSPISDARAGAGYRNVAAGNLLLRFFMNLPSSALHFQPPTPDHTPSERDLHDSAVGHVTGEAVYIEDMVAGDQMLTGRVVYSPHAHARIERIDISEAKKVKGVRSILTAGDIPGVNQMGPVIHDEPCLASGEVVFRGQAVVLIAAGSEHAADLAERLVRIDYTPLPAVISLEEAIAQGDLIAPERTIARGDVEAALRESPFRIAGTLHTGAQEHWYLETQSALVLPGEGTEMKVLASSQNPSETQAIVAEVLGLAKNDVEVEVRRLGGGFGGKETQGNHVAAWAALLAHDTRQPVRIRLFRDDDQIMTGKRHRFLSRYEIGFDASGKILAYKAELNSDAGAATDLSRAILERAMLHADNAYYLPAVRITGRTYRTNLPSNTAFRGFGGPQGMAVIENAIDRVARHLGKDPSEIRYLNFYRPDTGNLTPYGQQVRNNRLFLLHDKLMASSGYAERRRMIRAFNQSNEFMKKGLAMTPVKFGISFTTSFLNQAGALVNIYTDGTVLVSHGGTEMGQGLHTKIRRVAALGLGVSTDQVKLSPTNTSKVPNTSATAASSGSDLNGMAVKDAIDRIKARLIPFAAKELSGMEPPAAVVPEDIVFASNEVYSVREPFRRMSFASLCNAARLNRISLSATGFYATPGVWFDRESGQGEPFYYYAFGMAVSEVLVDTLTGRHTLLRTDILHDVGDSLNPAIDKGQITGGFIQGVGWCTTEEIRWDPDGRLLTFSPDTYKIPTIADIPADFRVDLLADVPNEGTIHRSKAVGEPPFMLALSVWLAIKDAVASVADPPADPVIPIPATGEVIVIAAENLKKPAS